MITEYKSALYRISYQGVSMIENALGNPNLIQISVVLGCSIIVSPQQGGGIQYLPNGESRKWFLYGVNTKLNKTGHHFIYARLNRDGDQAYLIFSVNDYAIDGTINGENPSQVYYYVKVGEITETDALEGATKQRKITFDYGKYQTDETREGNFWQLRADSQGNEYIITKYPVLSQGAFTQYATLDPVVPSIFEGIPYDNQTIWFNPATQRVEVIGGTGGGEAGSVKWVNITGKPTWIGDTKPTYNWSEIQGEKPFYTKEEIASKYVTIDTEQDITALKHFTAGLSVGESKKKIYEENGVVYIDADVAVTGAMTFYATAGRTVSTIMDAVTVDGITIKKENNVLKAVSGAGSSFDENAMWSALSGSSDNQINKSHLTNALAGYATESWVTGKGYATESWVASKNYATTEALNAVSNKLNDFLEGSDTDTIINKWKELEAFLSGMAETDNLAEILKTKADRSYVDSTFVTLSTKQTITGEKTFSSVLNTAAIKASGEITTPSLAASDYVTIAGIKLRKLEDGALMLEGNLALTGALTMYASNGQKFDTIYDGLPIDNDTIYWQEVDGSRVLKAREGSGSSFDESAMWAALEGATTEQINKTHLTTALTGYATESWVTGKGYITSSALNGYATESWVTSKNYAVKSTTLAGYGITDAYTKTDADSRYVNVSGDTMTGTLRLPADKSLASVGNLFIGNTKIGSTTTTDSFGIYAGDNIFLRPSSLTGELTYGLVITKSSLTYNNVKVWHEGNDGSGSGMDADTIDGVHANGLLTALTTSSATNLSITVGGTTKSITDLYAYASTKLETARSLWGNNFDGTASISGTIQFTSNEERWLLQTKRSDNTQINGIKTNGFQMCTYFGDTKTMQFGSDKIYSYVDFRAEKDLYINGIRLHKTADGVITLDGNLAVTGGVTTYAIDPVSASTIMDGVVVDGTTIKKENGKLVAVGGGEAGSVQWENISGKPSVFATNIANITDLHSSWDSVLAAQKPAWLTAVSIATISDLNSGWDALLKAAPSAYVTRWPTISEVTNKQNLIVKLNGGTTEGTNQFTYNATGAKTINITPAGIGAAASSHNHSWSNITSGKPTTLAGYGITDAPTKTGSGASGTWGIGITGNAGSASKLQTTHTIWGKDFNGTQNISGEISDCTRIRNSKDNSLYLGNSDNTGWVYTQDIASHNGVENWAIGITGTAWFQNVNIGYAHPATGNHPLNVNGVISGYAYTGRNIRIECDNAGNNIEARSSEINNYNGKLYLQHDTSQDLICCKGGGRVGIGIDVPNAKLHVIGAIYTSEIVSAYGYTGNHVRIECDNNGSNTAARIDEVNNYMAPLYLQHNTGNNLICCNGGGNVGIGTTSPAAKLDVNGDIFCRSVESTYTSTANEEFSIDRSNLWCKAVPVISNYKYRYVLGWQDRMAGGWTTGYGIGTYRSNDGSWGSMTFEVCQYETSKTRKAQLEIRGRDNVLWFSGDILTEGGSSFYGSDIRYKSITQQVKLSLSDIAKAPSFVYHWNREGMKCDRLNLGGSAQYTQSVLPWAVEDNSNFLMMDYATVAYTFAVHTARHLLTYESRTDKKIKKLEREIVILKKQLKKLGYEEVRTLDDQSV